MVANFGRAKADPTRPAIMTRVSTGPNSRARVRAKTPPTAVPAPKLMNSRGDLNGEATIPTKAAVIRAMSKDSGPHGSHLLNRITPMTRTRDQVNDHLTGQKYGSQQTLAPLPEI